MQNSAASRVDACFGGKTAIVTGAASGIGRAPAAELLRAGARVVLADIQVDRLAATVAETMTTDGYGDKVPMTAPGRLVCFLVMLTGVVVISLFTAAATSLLTVSHLRPRVPSKGDLPHAVSVAIEGSTAAEYLRRNRLPLVTAQTFDEAQRILERGDAAAFVHPRVALQAGLHRHPGRVLILPLALEEQFYAFPLPSNAAHRAWLNRALQAQLDSPEWDATAARYLRE